VNTYEIPLTPTPQSFSIALGGVTYKMTVVWVVGCGWVLNIADANGVSIVNGVPLVTGVDLLDQYAYLGFTGSLVVQTDHDADAVPTFDNLGLTSHLFFVTS
jgi:hypothetical protein